MMDSDGTDLKDSDEAAPKEIKWLASFVLEVLVIIAIVVAVGFLSP
jgi:hypothetical protein